MTQMPRTTGRSRHSQSGFSLVGLLVSMACIVVLMVILMTATNRAVTGEGATRDNTVFSVVDQTILRTHFMALTLYANENNGVFPVPTEIAGSKDVSLNTTASFWSAMLMGQYLNPDALLSANEFNGFVDVITNYDYNAYDPNAGVYWDPAFKADLDYGSHVSFAHTPMFGDRFELSWHDAGNGHMPIIGTRGPIRGKHDPNSTTYGRGGVWGGHVLTVNGSIHFLETFYAPNVYLEKDETGERPQDNIYNYELGIGGADCLLSFTKIMDTDGPVLQHD